MFQMLSVFFFLFLSGCVSATSPDEKKPTTRLEGKVVKIVDGDTYDVLLGDSSTVRIRMYGIDAPERRMPFYQKSKDMLGSICFGKYVRVEKTGTDRNKRIIARTYILGREEQEVGLQMILQGMAWHFKRYSKDADLAKAEDHARENKIGLWSDPNPIAPWEWRKR